MQVIQKTQDLRRLLWTKTRHSSGTAGSFLKAYEIRKGKKYYYKLSNYDSVNGITGHECVNEIIADRLLTVLKIPHLSYQLIKARIIVHGKETVTYLCKTEDFKEKGDSKIALDALYEMESEAGETPLEFCKRMGFETYIYQMLFLDFLILNRDRHGANIEILKNKRTKTLRPAPLFDHGISLVFSCHSDDALKDVDPAKDRTIQSFIGTTSAFQNLELIPKSYTFQLPEFDQQFHEYLFEGIDDIMSEVWINTVWNFLKERYGLYEDFCNQRRG